MVGGVAGGNRYEERDEGLEIKGLMLVCVHLK
jgi:hypothetical protein